MTDTSSTSPAKIYEPSLRPPMSSFCEVFGAKGLLKVADATSDPFTYSHAVEPS